MPKIKAEFEDIKLYGDDVTIRFYPNSHRYFLLTHHVYVGTEKSPEAEDWLKIPLPSVTSITGIIDKSSQLLAWAERLTNEYALNWVEEAKETTDEWQGGRFVALPKPWQCRVCGRYYTLDPKGYGLVAVNDD